MSSPNRSIELGIGRSEDTGLWHVLTIADGEVTGSWERGFESQEAATAAMDQVAASLSDLVKEEEEL